MANIGFKGIDVRQTGTALVFRAFLQTSAGALLGTGTTTIKLYELQSDGTTKSYDFSDNTFKTTALTTETLALTHRPGNNATTTTGNWTVALTTLTGFTVGGVYQVLSNNAGASPTDQMREFQFGSEQGDYVVGSIPAFAAGVNGGLPTVDANNGVKFSVGTGAGQLNVSSGKVPATMAAGDGADSLAVKNTIGVAGAGLTALPPGTLTTAERTAIANEVEAQIIDETDAEKVLTAIVNKVNATDVDLAGLSVAAIASATSSSVWSAATRRLSDGTNIVLVKGVGVTGFNDPTPAANATAVWTDATPGDFSVNSSPGKVVVNQLGGALSGSVFTAPALVNAPGGGGGSPWDQLAADHTIVGSFGELAGLGAPIDSGQAQGGSSSTIQLKAGTVLDTTKGDYEVFLYDGPGRGYKVRVTGFAAGPPPTASFGTIPVTVDGTSKYLLFFSSFPDLGPLGLDRLDSSDPGVSANHTTLTKKLAALYRRFYGPVVRTPTQLKTLANNGTTVNTTQAVTDDGAGNESQGGAT